MPITTKPQLVRPGDIVERGPLRFLVVHLPTKGNALAQLGTYEQGGGTLRHLDDMFRPSEDVSVLRELTYA